MPPYVFFSGTRNPPLTIKSWSVVSSGLFELEAARLNPRTFFSCLGCRVQGDPRILASSGVLRGGAEIEEVRSTAGFRAQQQRILPTSTQLTPACCVQPWMCLFQAAWIFMCTIEKVLVCFMRREGVVCGGAVVRARPRHGNKNAGSCRIYCLPTALKSRCIMQGHAM